MRILAISLMRIGDFFQHKLILDCLGEAEIHVLTFTENRVAAELFPKFHFHFIDRKSLQQDLILPTRPWMRAVLALEDEIDALMDYRFDQVYNLTPTKFAGRIVDAFDPTSSFGFRFREGHPYFPTEVARRFNQDWLDERQPSKTAIEMTAMSVGIDLPPASRAVPSFGNQIWIQPWTSDIRKTWPLTFWREFSGILESYSFHIRYLLAPNEIAISEAALGPDLRPTSFLEVRNQRASCRLLLSGDTSMLHFAVLESIPVVGLFFGPGDFLRTPPRQADALILKPSLDCYPCAPRGECTVQAKGPFPCHQDLSPNAVADAVLKHLDNQSTINDSRRTHVERT